jgi:hypothetical protein
MAAGPFSIITGALGESDPEEDIGKWSDENQKRNRLALGLDENGNPLPARAAAPAAAAAPGGGGPSAEGAAQAQAASTLPPQQEPNATKTPVSLGHLMMNLQQYNERSQGFNQALGMGFAAFAQPRDRQMVSGMFNTTPMDPLKAAQTQMSLGQQQQGQDRANAVTQIINGPGGQAIADQLHMDLGVLRNMVLSDPGAAGKIAQQLGTPTDKMRDLTQIGHMGGGGPGGPGGPGGSAIGDIKSGIASGIAGPENQPMLAAQESWRQRHLGQPDSAMPWHVGDLSSFKQWQTTEASNESDRQIASGELPTKNETALTLKGDLEELKDSPGLHSILTTAGKRDVAKLALADNADVPTMMAKWGLTNEEAKAVALLRRIGGATTESAMHSMAGTGTRVTQAEVGPLKDAILMTQNLNLSYDDYIHGAINNAVTKTKRQIAANYGNTGNVKNMDPEFSPWLHDAYKKGGQLYKEGSGADDLKAAEPIPDTEIADGKELLADHPYLKDEMLDNWQQRGFDTSKLRGKNPSKW